jgi:CubicO group peptidase (beta-lactamase class C family)
MSMKAVAFLFLAVSQPAHSANSFEDLQHYVQRSLGEWQTPGAGLTLVKDGKVVLGKGFGVRSVQDRSDVDENTRFALGSCSKAFGSASVAALVGDGKVSWDERLRHYLPELALWDPWVAEHITVRDMLSHRTGTSLDVEAKGMSTIRAPQDWVRRLQFEQPVAGFREKYVYSNAMYVASALMVERLTGQEWNDFAAERLWRPLRMERTNGSLALTLKDSNRAAPHFLVDNRVETSDVQFFRPGTIPATGNVMSTAHDMGRWLLFQLGEGTVENQVVMPAASLHETHTPQIPIRGGAREAAYYFSQINSETLKTRDWSYGMGWFINDYRGQKMVWHGGTVPGFRCMVGFLPDAKVGVYVGVNRTSLLPVALFFRAVDALIGAPATDWSEVFKKETQYQDAQSLLETNRKASARVTGTQPSLDLGRYRGTYASDALGDLRVYQQSNGLRVDWGLRAGRLTHWNYDTFAIIWDRPEFDDRPLLTFQLDSAAHITSASLADVGIFDRRPEPQ